MDPGAVRRTLEPTASPEDISGSTPYDSFVISGVRLDAADHGRVLCSFLVTPRHASPQGYLLSGVTATLADQMGSAVIYSIGVGPSGVSLEISVSYLDTATVGEEIEVEGKLLRAGKSVCVISIDFRKKRTGKLIAQARHTKYLAFHQYQVVGRALPTPGDEQPKIYRMKLWATNEVRAKSKFWYFLRKLKKVKKANGQMLAINEEEIEVEGKMLRAGKSVCVISIDFRKKRTGKLIAQARHTKYLAVSSKL
ncbi:hypothetical protein QYE76_044116 [Lolium multiflorum]|uniref:Acyl-coenzyme A thioesterase 13 n=1 Tax=Lolium multiflorum TaxID=4521 RepID=A0AAD8WYT7_LOLMU|nr:hypothetical protein QYE76_044116 [Lolium multiflorum]